MISREQYEMRKAYPLDLKIQLSKKRIEQWYNYWNGSVYVSFSGGKDSTVLLHMVRDLYPEVPAVFFNTGLEYPEIVEFVKTIENVTWIKPNINFRKVIRKYGYPVISKIVSTQIETLRNPTENNRNTRRLILTGRDKHNNKNKRYQLKEKYEPLVDADFKISAKCCKFFKKDLGRIYHNETGRYPYIGLTSDESMFRQNLYSKNGCNSYKEIVGKSMPMYFWSSIDVWKYIDEANIDYSRIYDMGYDRTGCMFCMFGIQYERYPNRFQKMQKTHPELWNYCINKLGCGKVLDALGVEYKAGTKLVRKHNRNVYKNKSMVFRAGNSLSFRIPITFIREMQFDIGQDVVIKLDKKQKRLIVKSEKKKVNKNKENA